MERSSRTPAVRWVKQWVPQDVVLPGGKCMLLKWVKEDLSKALKEKCKKTVVEETKPQPTVEKLVLCSHEGCGRTFLDYPTFKKHAQIHGVKQHVCPHDGCESKFLDSSKLRRHLLVHTGERMFKCTFQGCNKAFTLAFNLNSHMKTHSLENYHICPYKECGKRFTTDYKLDAHIKKFHEKNRGLGSFKRNQSEKKLQNRLNPTDRSASADRPHSCPYEGCEKAYIHEYKLKLHLRKEHPDYTLEGNGNGTPAGTNHSMPDASGIYGCVGRGGNKRTNLLQEDMPPAKVARMNGSSFTGR